MKVGIPKEIKNNENRDEGLTSGCPKPPKFKRG